MSCDTTKFTITRGEDNTFIFAIKANGSTLPMDITTGTYTAKLVSLESDAATPLTVNRETPYADGKISISVPANVADTLTRERGTKADRYYLKPTYKLIIDCKDTPNGDFLAKVPEVYVD